MNSKNKDTNTRSSDDYARQQEDIRATQTYSDTSLDRGSDRTSSGGQELNRTSAERERGQGVRAGSGKPVDLPEQKVGEAYDISPTATPPKL